jgi:peptidoglycan/LPS O-acetylase OafA/YrhL
MERCQSSSRHDSYGVNANCPDDAVVPSTPAVRAWFFLVAVCVTVTGGVLRTPEVGGELLGAAGLGAGLFVAAAVVPSVAAVVVGPLVAVVALPFVVVVTSCVVTVGSVVLTTPVVVVVARQ